MSIQDFLANANKTVTKRKQVKEIDIESDFVTFAKGLKCWPAKLVLLRKKGFPDRAVMCPGGSIFFIEFKRKGKTRTAPQSKVMRMLKALGFLYYTVDKPGQAEQLLEQFLNGSTTSKMDTP